jgi:hypothetical protein
MRDLRQAPSGQVLDPTSRHAVVFSHPNHELAIYGLVQRLRPYLLFLTDGGGEARVEQTRRGLESIGLADRATFLGYPEQSFYDALLVHDLELLGEVRARVAEWLTRIRPDHVLCDAVEFYNPVHDLTLPIVRTALSTEAAGLYEVPLIYQKPGAAEAYEVQRLPPGEHARAIQLTLRPTEVAAKQQARESIYVDLRAQLGNVLTGLPIDRLAEEQIATARISDVAPVSADRVLRYEWRGALLRQQQRIASVIRWADHYVPVVRRLTEAAAR